MKFKRGYPITFLLHGRQFEHGLVVAESPEVIQFVFRHAPRDTPTLVASKDDEHALWTRGWLRWWWWPPHRQTKKAMLAAAAMGTGRIGIHTTIADKIQQRSNEMWEKLNGDMNKVLGDFERVFNPPKLPGTITTTTYRYKIRLRR